MDPITETPAAETPATPPLSFGDRLSAAAAALGGSGTAAEVATLRGQVEALTTERDALTAAATAAVAQIATLQTDLAAARARIQEAETAVTNFEARVQTASIARVAAAGIPTEELPKVTAAGEDPAAKLRAELAALAPNDSVRKGEIVGKLLKLRNGNN